jgi:hypothetical protein
MHMKKILLPFVMLFGVILFDSCQLDKLDTPAVLSTPPVISVTGPTAVTAGSTTDLVAVASDGKLSGTTVVSQNTSTTVVNGAITLKILGTVTKDLFPGTYKLNVSAIDSQGKTSTPFAVDIAVTCPPLASCIVPGKLTVVLLVPANTPANASVGLVGESTGWGGSGPDLEMTKIATGCYCVASGVKATDALDEFKFRLDNTWDKEILNSDCTAPGNFKYLGDDLTKPVTYTAAKWKTLCP